jgi:hypothetical protein
MLRVKNGLEPTYSKLPAERFENLALFSASLISFRRGVPHYTTGVKPRCEQFQQQ